MQGPITFEMIDWHLYFGVFHEKLTKGQSRDKSPNSLIRLMEALDLQFKENRLKESLSRFNEASRQLEPFSCYKLAQIYMKDNKFQEAPDESLMWFYLAKAATLVCIKYSRDVIHAKEKLQKIIDERDQNLQKTLELIERHESKETASILKYCFLLVFRKDQNENATAYIELLKEIDKLLAKQPSLPIIELLISLITARLHLKHKPYEPLLDILLRNGAILLRFVQDSYNLIGLLLSCYQDNIFLSKQRDDALQLMYICRIFKFAIQDGDEHFYSISETVFKIFSRLYQGIEKVSLLQDRVFVTYYLCEMLFIKKMKEQSKEIFHYLESLIGIKPQPGIEGFFNYLKSRILNNPQFLEKAAQIYEKEPQIQANHQMIIAYYLSRINFRLKKPEEAENKLHKANRLYLQNHQYWNQVTLQTTWYFRQICRKLKKLKKHTYNQPPLRFFKQFVTPFATSLQHAKQALEVQPDLIEMDDRDIKPIRVICKTEKCVFFQAVYKSRWLCTVQQIPMLSQAQKDQFVSDIQQKHTILHKNLLRMAGFCLKKIDTQYAGYYNVCIVYPPVILHELDTFEDKVRELSCIVSAYNYASDRLDPEIVLKAYNMDRDLVIMGWGSTKVKQKYQQNELFMINSVREMLEYYKLQFLGRKIKETEMEQLQRYLDGLYIRI